MADSRTPVQPPTIGDMARPARVSRATVSRVLNRYPHVRPQVRAAVQQAVRALGYRPDHVARSLARRETQTLGLMQAAGELGLRIPQDLAVVRFDDIAITSHRQIQLTTMAQQKTERGRLAAEGALEIIRDPGRFARQLLQRVLAPTLMVRRTCGSMPAARRRGQQG